MPDKPIVSIMIVENNQEVINAFTNILEDERFRLVRDNEFYFIDNIGDAIANYQQLHTIHKEPDITIVSFDMKHNDNDDISFLNYIRNLKNNAFILASSAQASSEKTLAARMNSTDGFITTPPTYEVMNKYIQRYFQNIVARESQKHFESVQERLKWTP